MADAVTAHRGLSTRSPPPRSHEGELAEGVCDEVYDKLTLTRSPSLPARPQLDAAEDNSGLPLPNPQMHSQGKAVSDVLCAR